MDYKEYRKTWYYKFIPRFVSKKSPENWISGRPIKFMGFRIGFLWKIARPNYPWARK